MAKQELEPEKYNPDDNLKVFATRGLIVWLVVALAIHVLVIGGTSVGYMVKAVFNIEEPDEQQGEADKTDEDTQDQQDAQTDEGAGEGDETSADGQDAAEDEDEDAQQNADASGDGNGDDGEKTQEQLMKEREDSEVVQEAGETASPEEIPENPEDLGIDIDETN